MLAVTNFISKDVDVVSAKAMISFGVRLVAQSCRLERTGSFFETTEKLRRSSECRFGAFCARCKA
jgi:hypothetical protein